MLVGAMGLALLLTILGVVLKPSTVITGSVGWSYGGFVALVAALVTFLAALRSARVRP